MTIVVDLPHQIESRVQQEALRQQMTPEAYIAYLSGPSLFLRSSLRCESYEQ